MSYPDFHPPGMGGSGAYPFSGNDGNSSCSNPGGGGGGDGGGGGCNDGSGANFCTQDDSLGGLPTPGTNTSYCGGAVPWPLAQGIPFCINPNGPGP